MRHVRPLPPTSAAAQRLLSTKPLQPTPPSVTPPNEMKSTSPAKQTIEKICPSFRNWPRRWEGLAEDVPYGEGILTVFAPFLQQLIDSGNSRKTVRNHGNNLWLLGGEIIRQVSTFEEYDVPPRRMVMESVDSEGGLLCRHLDTPSACRSYDATCRKLHEFLNEK